MGLVLIDWVEPKVNGFGPNRLVEPKVNGLDLVIGWVGPKVNGLDLGSGLDPNRLGWA